jgi:hypothetical protein
VRDQGWTDWATPAHGATHHWGDHSPMCDIESFKGVRRCQHLGQVGAVGIKIELDLVVFAPEAMSTHRKSVPVHLVAMTQTRLDHSPPVFNMIDEACHVVDVIAGERSRVLGDDGTKQHATEAGRWVDREHEVAKGQSTCWLSWARMVHLKFCQQHGPNRTDATNAGRSVLRVR